MIDARDIAALVPMPELLIELGFVVNERSHRGPCSLHAGQNPDAVCHASEGCQ